MMFKLYLALAVAFILAVGIGYRACHRQWEMEQQVKAEKKVKEKTEEVTREQEKARARVEKMDPADLLRYWGGLQHDGPGSGAPPTPGKAKSAKP